MKTCSQCNQTLSLDCFDKQSTGKMGRRADCKECRKRFTRTKSGLIKSIYGEQCVRSKSRGYQPPAYTEGELYAWAVNNPVFQELYDAWVSSGFQSRFKPSIDRLNDYISYRLDNIQLITWDENNQKGYVDRILGNNNKKNIAVDMLSLDGKFIERFHSVSEAARRFKGIPSNIIGAINSRVTHRRNPDGSIRTFTKSIAYGHRWRYSTVPNNNQEVT